MRDTISRVGEDIRARRGGRSANGLEAARIVADEHEAVRTKGISIDLAEVIADLPGARIRVLELEDRFLDHPRHFADLDGTAIVDEGIGLLVRPGVSWECVNIAAGGDAIIFALAAGVDVDGEGAVVAHVRLAGSSGEGVDEGDGRATGDDGGGGHGGRWVDVVGWGWSGKGRDGEVSHGYDGCDDGRWEIHCWSGWSGCCV